MDITPNYCPNCGAKLDRKCNFCSDCGFKFDSEQESKTEKKIPNTIDFGNDNVITRPEIGDVSQTINQIEQIKITSGITAEQFTQLSKQLNLILEQIGISTEIDKDGKQVLNDDQRLIADAVEKKMEKGSNYFDKPVGDPETFLRLGNKAYENKDYQTAIRQYDYAIQIDSDDAAAWNNKGVALLDLGRLDEAMDCYDHALKIDPDDAAAWYNKGVALLDLGRLDEAVDCYDHALKIDPDYAAAWNNKGVSLFKIGRLDEAMDCYDHALKIDPDDANPWFLKGVALADLGRLDEAVDCYDHALKIDPDDAAAWNNKGIALQNLGRLDEAVEYYDHALKIDPNYADAWNNKAIALDDLGRLDEATDDQRKIIEAAKEKVREEDDVFDTPEDNPETYLRLGNKAYDDELYETAIQHYNHALRINPDYADAWYNKGLALGYLGHLKESLECYDHVLEIDSECEDAWFRKRNILYDLGKMEDALECF